MENASKALLMAGGALIAMLVMSLGIYFYRTLSDATGEIYSRMEQKKIIDFNQKFLKYNNTEVTIQDIITMINLAKDNNRKYSFKPEDRPTDPENSNSYYITVEIGEKVFNNDDYIIENAEQYQDNDITTILTEKMSSVDAAKTYNCEVNVNDTTQYVNYIKITQIY